MGCGSSRLDENGLVIGVKARLLLFLRFEEFKRRRQTQAYRESCRSNQILLCRAIDQDQDEDNVSSLKPLSPSANQIDGNEAFFLAAADDTDSCVLSEEGSKGGGSPERDDCKNENAKATEEEEVKSIQKGKGDEESDHQQARLNNVTLMVKTTIKDDHEEVKFEDVDHRLENDEDDNGEDDDDDGRKLGYHREDDFAFSASPSFRVYCTECNMRNNENEDEDDHDLPEKAPFQKDDPKPLEPPQVAAVNQQVKKGKKKRNFKKVLPMGKQAKNLFNMRACMSSPGSSNNPDHSHLLIAKAHA